MQVVAKSIDDIKPYEHNPRNNDDAVDAVANSIKEFGWQQPIVVDNEGVIIAGHTRYKAAKKLGLKTVPIVIAKDLSEEQVKAYRLADNKSGELASWDSSLLDAELIKVSDIDMSQFGFEDIADAELPDDFFEENSDQDKNDDEDQSNELVLDWGTKQAPISKEEQELLDKKLGDFDSNKEGNKSFLQFLMEE